MKMKASELIKILEGYPEAEVIIDPNLPRSYDEEWDYGVINKDEIEMYRSRHNYNGVNIICLLCGEDKN